MLLGETVVTSVHVLFDESIHERSADYFKEIKEATVVCVNLTGLLWINHTWMKGCFTTQR